MGCQGPPGEKHLGRLSRGMTTGKNPEEKLGKQKPGEKEQVDCQAEDVGGWGHGYKGVKTKALWELQVVQLPWSLR